MLYHDGKKSMNRVGHAPLVVLRLMIITLAARYQESIIGIDNLSFPELSATKTKVNDAPN